jgi:AcrR family transcriptional regulator
MASKTAERILLVSLELFNHHGEANITSVDIANELDMSPGNLYYHFKGKEEITTALFAMYHDRMKKILFAPEQETLLIKEFFYFLYVTFETTHLFRFLYRNPSDLVDKYPYIERGFKQLIKAKEKGFKQLLSEYATQGSLRVQPEQIVHLTELISMVLTQGLNYYTMKGDDIDDGDVIYRAMATIFFAITPYLTIEPEQIQALQLAITNCALDDT